MSQFRIGLAVVLATTTVAVSAPRTHAAHLNSCQYKEQIFVRNTTDRQYTNGSDNKIFVRNRTLDDDCYGNTLSTTNLHKGPPSSADWFTWVEVGWIKGHTGTDDIVYRVFVEKGVDGSVTQYTSFNPSRFEVGTWDRYRVLNPIGTTNWNLSINYLDGSGWHGLEQYSTLWDNGVATGETERKGNETRMTDEQRDLLFKNNSNDWLSWSGTNCATDNHDGSGFGWVRVSDHAYDVTNTGNNCN